MGENIAFWTLINKSIISIIYEPVCRGKEVKPQLNPWINWKFFFPHLTYHWLLEVISSPGSKCYRYFFSLQFSASQLMDRGRQYIWINVCAARNKEIKIVTRVRAAYFFSFVITLEKKKIYIALIQIFNWPTHLLQYRIPNHHNCTDKQKRRISLIWLIDWFTYSGNFFMLIMVVYFVGRGRYEI